MRYSILKNITEEREESQDTGRFQRKRWIVTAIFLVLVSQGVLHGRMVNDFPFF